VTVSALNVALNVRMSKTGDGPRQAERDLRQLRKAAGDLGREAGAAKLNREVAKVGTSAAIADRALRSARRSAADLGSGASGAARLSRELDHVARSAETAHRALNRGGLGRRIINGAGGGHMAEAGGTGLALGFGARALAPLGAGYGAYRAGEAAVSFEKAMAEVKKKVDINNPGDIEYLETRIRKIAIQLGIARTEVAGLVAEAGASGIPYNDLEEYMRLVAKASVGWDVSARETSEKLAYIRSGFGMNMKELNELGDMINGLGDNSAAKEREIVEMLGRTGAAAQAANVPLKTTLAVMTAVRSTGMQEEVVARWFASLASTLRTAPQQPKRVSEGLKMLGLTAKGVAEGMKKDATGTLLDLFEKLEKAPDMATAAIKIFGREWWDETARAGKALPEIKRMLAFIKDPKNYAGSLDKGLAIQLSTSANHLQRFKQLVEDIGDRMTRWALPGLNAAIDGAIKKVEDLQSRAGWLERAAEEEAIRLRTSGEFVPPGSPAAAPKSEDAPNWIKSIRKWAYGDDRTADTVLSEWWWGKPVTVDPEAERARRLGQKGPGNRAQGMAAARDMSGWEAGQQLADASIRGYREARRAEVTRIVTLLDQAARLQYQKDRPGQFPDPEGTTRKLGELQGRLREIFGAADLTPAAREVMERYATGLSEAGGQATAEARRIADQLRSILNIELTPRISPQFSPPASAPAAGGGIGKQTSTGGGNVQVTQHIHGTDPAATARHAQREQARAVRTAMAGALHDLGSWA